MATAAVNAIAMVIPVFLFMVSPFFSIPCGVECTSSLFAAAFPYPRDSAALLRWTLSAARVRCQSGYFASLKNALPVPKNVGR
jgi:hypothetical protein